LKKHKWGIRKVIIIYNELITYQFREQCCLFLSVEEIGSKNFIEFKKIFPIPSKYKAPFLNKLINENFFLRTEQYFPDTLPNLLTSFWNTFLTIKQFRLLDSFKFLENNRTELEKAEKIILNISNFPKEKQLKLINELVFVYKNNLESIVQLLFLRQFLISNFNFNEISMFSESFQILLTLDKFLYYYIKEFHRFLCFYVQFMSHSEYQSLVLQKTNET
jgi:hypothetical protein